MLLARYALYAGGVELYVAPTWDRGEPWLSTLRHIAKEGRVVVSCGNVVRTADVPDRYAFKSAYLGDAGEWLNPGDSMIVDPDGKPVAGRCVTRTHSTTPSCTAASGSESRPSRHLMVGDPSNLRERDCVASRGRRS
jgi:predicted amidohydrolase